MEYEAIKQSISHLEQDEDEAGHPKFKDIMTVLRQKRALMLKESTKAIQELKEFHRQVDRQNQEFTNKTI